MKAATQPLLGSIEMRADRSNSKPEFNCYLVQRKVFPVVQVDDGKLIGAQRVQRRSNDDSPFDVGFGR